MKIVCECGEITELIDGEDGSDYTHGEGWYKAIDGNIEVGSNHHQIFLHCLTCGREEWFFK